MQFRPWRCGLLAAVVTFCLAPPVWAARVTVELPDRSVSLQIIPLGKYLYLDARAVASAVSGQLQVDAARGHASLQGGPHPLHLALESAEVRIGDRSVTLSAPSRARGRTFLVAVDILPVALGERFGQAAVEWDPRRRIARIRSGEATITRLRVGTYPTHTRVVLETTHPLEWTIREEGTALLRLVVPGGVLAPTIRPLELRSGIVRAVHPAQEAQGVEVRLVRGPGKSKVRAFALRGPDRIVVDVLVLPAAEKAGGAGTTPSGASSRLPASRSASPADVLRPPPVPPLVGRPSGRTGQASTQPAGVPVPTGDGRAPVDGAVAEGPGGAPEMGTTTGAPDPRLPETLTVVLDPGHGGHDTGAVGPRGLMEKDVVLDLAFRLRRLLQDRLGLRVLMTRTEDVFVSLPERTAFANRAKADFFLSLHVNGARKRGAVGFETFYFSREPSDGDARASAQRENLVIEQDGATGKDKEWLLKMTLADMAVTRDMRESSELAEFLLGALDKILKVENRGVKSGPFYVLATAAMPAVLVESAFITNPREERNLQRERHRQRIAEALFEGVAKYKARYQRRLGMRAVAPPTDS